MMCGVRVMFEDVMRFVYFQGQRNTIPNLVSDGTSSITKHIGISIVCFGQSLSFVIEIRTFGFAGNSPSFFVSFVLQYYRIKRNSKHCPT